MTATEIPVPITPDGYRYLAAVEQRVARPFHYRWLLPRLCGHNGDAWRQQSIVAICLLAAAGGFYTHSWFGAVAPLGLAGVTKFNLKYPVLVDASAMALALAAAVFVREGWWPLGLVCVLTSACIKETSPAFAALYAWNPVLLVGFVPVAIRHFQRAGDDVLDAENRWILNHPFRASLKYHRNVPLWVWVLPWGALIAGLAYPTWQVAACVAVAYAQCAMATDTCRLYQWGWPVLALNVVAVVPTGWLLPLALVHLGNAFATEGG